MTLMSPDEIRDLAADPVFLAAACDDTMTIPPPDEIITTVRYSLDRIARHAERNPGVLAAIADDLIEVYELVVPAAEALDELAAAAGEG